MFSYQPQFPLLAASAFVLLSFLRLSLVHTIDGGMILYHQPMPGGSHKIMYELLDSCIAWPRLLCSTKMKRCDRSPYILVLPSEHFSLSSCLGSGARVTASKNVI